MSGKLITQGKLVRTGAGKLGAGLGCCCDPIPCPYFCDSVAKDRYVEISLSFDVITGQCCYLGDINPDPEQPAGVWAKVISFPSSITIIAEPATVPGMPGPDGCEFLGCVNIRELVEVELYNDAACTVPLAPYGQTDYAVQAICAQFRYNPFGAPPGNYLWVDIFIQRSAGGASLNGAITDSIDASEFTLTGCCFSKNHETSIPREHSFYGWEDEFLYTTCANPIVLNGQISVCSYPIEEI